MENFRFENQTKILFGKRTQEQAGAYVKMFSDRALILYGSGRIKKTGLFQEITDSLSREGVSYIEFGGITANPRLSDVEKVIRLCRENGIHFILAVGGGSVIDAAKAAALGAECSGILWDYFDEDENFPVSEDKINELLEQFQPSRKGQHKNRSGFDHSGFGQREQRLYSNYK